MKYKEGDIVNVYGYIARHQDSKFLAEVMFMRGTKAKVTTTLDGDELIIKILEPRMRIRLGEEFDVHAKQLRKLKRTKKLKAKLKRSKNKCKLCK